MTDEPPEDGDAREPDDADRSANVVRSYTLTSGRTTGRQDVPLEATVEPTRAGRARQWPAHDPNGAIIDLCAGQRLSVAEVAALCDLPIGVTRVLIGDLAADRLLTVQQTLTEHSSRDERLDLIERTLRGLRDL